MDQADRNRFKVGRHTGECRLFAHNGKGAGIDRCGVFQIGFHWSALLVLSGRLAVTNRFRPERMIRMRIGVMVVVMPMSVVVPMTVVMTMMIMPLPMTVIMPVPMTVMVVVVAGLVQTAGTGAEMITQVAILDIASGG